MHRRDFLKIGVVGTGSVIFSPLINACSPAVAQAAKTVGVWFAQYMVQLLAKEVFESIKEFAEGSSKVNEVNGMMAGNGFTETQGRRVYLCNGVYLYEVGHQDQFNGCAASFDGQKNNVALVEGPTVIGLARAAEDYRNNGFSSNETSNALLVTGDYQKPNRNAFGYNYDQPYVAYTDFGTVIVDYRVTSSSSGQVDVVVSDRNAQEAFHGSYPIEFS